MRRAILYTRVSTAAQAHDGVSLAAQRQRAEQWAEANGYELVGVFSDEGLSGKRADNRPGLQDAITAVCRSKGALVVYSLSRLARSTRDAIEIAEQLAGCGADLVSLTEQIDTTSAMGKAFYGILAVLAQLERDLISERTKAALAYKAEQGERIGEIPYGYRLAEDGITIEEDAEERSVLDQIHSLRAESRSWNEIAKFLNDNHITTKKGRQWTAQNARKICVSSVTTGA